MSLVGRLWGDRWLVAGQHKGWTPIGMYRSKCFHSSAETIYPSHVQLWASLWIMCWTLKIATSRGKYAQKRPPPPDLTWGVLQHIFSKDISNGALQLQKPQKEKKHLPNKLTKSRPLEEGCRLRKVEGGRLLGVLSLGKQAGSAIPMPKAGCLFGVCCGKCFHNPPRTVSMTPFTSITSQLPAPRHTISWPMWPPGVIVLAQSNAEWLHPSSLSSQPFCLPQLQGGSLITSICICGSLGPDDASHLSEVTQLLSKDLSPDLSAVSQVHLALKYWKQRSC